MSAAYVPLTIEVPEEIAPEIREFLERLKSGSIELHVHRGRIVASVLHSHKRIREPVKMR